MTRFGAKLDWMSMRVIVLLAGVLVLGGVIWFVLFDSLERVSSFRADADAKSTEAGTPALLDAADRRAPARSGAAGSFELSVVVETPFPVLLEAEHVDQTFCSSRLEASGDAQFMFQDRGRVDLLISNEAEGAYFFQTVTLSEPSTQIEARLPDQRRVRLVARDSQGFPQAGLRVVIHDAGPLAPDASVDSLGRLEKKAFERVSRKPVARTLDVDGSVEFTNLPPGSFELMAYGNDYPPLDRVGAFRWPSESDEHEFICDIPYIYLDAPAAEVVENGYSYAGGDFQQPDRATLAVRKADEGRLVDWSRSANVLELESGRYRASVEVGATYDCSLLSREHMPRVKRVLVPAHGGRQVVRLTLGPPLEVGWIDLRPVLPSSTNGMSLESFALALDFVLFDGDSGVLVREGSLLELAEGNDDRAIKITVPAGRYLLVVREGTWASHGFTRPRRFGQWESTVVVEPGKTRIVKPEFEAGSRVRLTLTGRVPGTHAMLDLVNERGEELPLWIPVEARSKSEADLILLDTSTHWDTPMLSCMTDTGSLTLRAILGDGTIRRVPVTLLPDAVTDVHVRFPEEVTR